MGTGTKASLPQKGYAKSLDLRDESDCLDATLHLEDAPNYVLDTTKWPGPESVRFEIVRAFSDWTTLGSGRRKATVEASVRGIRNLLKWIDQFNSACTDDGDRIGSLAHLTAASIQRYRIASPLDPTTLNGYTRFARSPLRFSPLVDPDVLKQLRDQNRDGSSSEDELRALITASDLTKLGHAARREIDRLHKEKTRWHHLALRHGDPDLSELEAVQARALHETLFSPEMCPSTVEGFKSIGAWPDGDLPNRLRQGLKTVARSRLFLTASELAPLAIRLALLEGFNRSVVETMTVPTEHEGGQIQLQLDKARRPQELRFWQTFVSGRNADMIMKIVDITQPGRDRLAALGMPTDALLVRLARADRLGKFAGPEGAGLSLELPQLIHTDQSWVPLDVNGNRIPLDFPLIRDSVPGGVQDGPTHHTARVNLTYLRNNPVAMEKHRLKAAEAFKKAKAKMRKKLRMTVAEAEQEGGAQRSSRIA